MSERPHSNAFSVHFLFLFYCCSYFLTHSGFILFLPLLYNFCLFVLFFPLIICVQTSFKVSLKMNENSKLFGISAA